ncbi:MAG TPA: DMT family transporter [Streptosporangiaceae bacterium]|nr:DMT family transporter [Streptosporangiaceae bacterium]
MGDKDAGRRGQPDAPPGPLGELHPDLALQRGKLCGLAGMTTYQLLLNTGQRIVPAGTAALLVATAPVYASLLAFCFLGERPGRRQWAGSAAALAGAALIACRESL